MNEWMIGKGKQPPCQGAGVRKKKEKNNLSTTSDLKWNRVRHAG